VMLLSVCRPSLVTLLQWPTSRDVSEVRLLLSARSTSIVTLGMPHRSRAVRVVRLLTRL
jgi:hypothetical protein